MDDVGYEDALHRALWLWADKHHRDELDGGSRLKRPPVLAKEAASRNVLVPSQRSKADGIRAAIREGQRHRWFRSLKSSQALTQSVFGAIRTFDCLDLLQDVPAECGRPAFCESADGPHELATADGGHRRHAGTGVSRGRGGGEVRPGAGPVMESGGMNRLPPRAGRWHDAGVPAGGARGIGATRRPVARRAVALIGHRYGTT